MDRTQQAMAQMAREDPELAARLVIQTLPAAAAKVPGNLTYGLFVDGVGDYTVTIDSGRASVTEGVSSATEFNLSTGTDGLAALAAGASPMRLLVSGRVRIRGNRLPCAQAARDVKRRRRPRRRDRKRRRDRSRPALPVAAVPDRPGVDARALLPPPVRDRRAHVGHRDPRRPADPGERAPPTGDSRMPR